MVIEMSSNWLKLIEPGLYGTDLGSLYEDCKEEHLEDFKHCLCEIAEKTMDEILKEDCIIEIFGNCYTSDVTFQSPAWYNYENDWLDFNLVVDRNKIFKYWDTFEPWDKETFFKWAKEKYGSRDGFISFFPYEPRDFEVALATESNKAGWKFERAVGMLFQYVLKINEIDLDAYQRDFEMEINEETYDNDWYMDPYGEEEEEE